MKIQIEKEMFEKFPQLKVGVLAIDGMNNTGESDISFQLLCKEMDRARKEGFDPSNDSWTDAFKKAGIDTKQILPSHVSLLGRVIDDAKDLPNLSNAVNVINMEQVRHKLPIGIHSLENLDGDVTIGKNDKALSFIPRESKGEEIVNANEIVYKDDINVITRNWVWRQGDKTLVEKGAKNAFLVIDSINDSQSKVTDILEEIADNLNTFVNPKEIRLAVLSKDNPRIDTESIKKIGRFKRVSVKGCKTILRDKKIIERILNKAVEDILPSKGFLKELLLSGRRLKIYQGFDPTAPTLHIGHSVGMRKLEDFRKLGHEVFFLIGDFTGRIGDPTDKTAARVQLTTQQVNENLKVFVEQASSIIDIHNKDNPVQVVFNSDWLEKLNFADIVSLASEFSVQQMLKRDMFQKRLEIDKPIFIHEFIYPLMQGFDSVHMEVDIEVGGNDQLFNMLAGRELVKSRLRKEKVVLAGKLLTTSEGEKMGKSEGNMIMLSDSANEIFGKVMAFSDNQIVPGFELLTDFELSDVEEIKESLAKNKNQMEFKKQLAFEIVKTFKGEAEALKAKDFFENVFQKKVFDNIPEVSISKDTTKIIDIMIESGVVKSRSEGRRLIEQGAVSVNSKKIKSWEEKIEIAGNILKVGRKVVKLV